MNYFRIWLASIRYSVVRAMMFRGDFLMWSLVETFWMAVNLLLVGVIYRHTESIAGWGAWEMTLLVGTSMVVQRLLMAFFWSNLFEMGRNVRTGHFDFFLAQPGNPLFMVSTRKLDLDGLINLPLALAVVIYAAHRLDLELTAGRVLAYGFLVLCGLAIHYATLLINLSLVFWLQSARGIEGGYFALNEYSRLPREALRGIASIVLVYTLPVVIVTNVPARTLLHGIEPINTLWLAAAAGFWFSVAVLVFNRGLRRYASASS
ncbi:MAG: ABC-2 family transporter protein [Opitutaceae bacterium]|jgi:ABC-2 type transport system permease protein|nr:ABC-2 family transporter protein [Opitutaceae bacterium]